MKALLIKNAEQLGWLSGWAFIIFFLVSNAVQIVIVQNQGTLPSKFIGIVETLIYYLLFIVFLFGIRAFAVRKADANLTKIANSLIVVNIVLMALYYPHSAAYYFEPNFLSILLVASVPVLCVYGILLLKLAEAFKSYLPELGKLAKRISLWNKITGWMLASVILIIPGLLVGLLGEFFLWRLLAHSRKEVV